MPKCQYLVIHFFNDPLPEITPLPPEIVASGGYIWAPYIPLIITRSEFQECGEPSVNEYDGKQLCPDHYAATKLRVMKKAIE